MRWWDLQPGRNNKLSSPKRLYFGNYLSDLDAGGSHVCAIIKDSGDLSCWRWKEISSLKPRDSSFTSIALGESFLCGLNKNQTIKCLGNDTNVVGKEPPGNYGLIFAGRRYVCAVKKSEFSLVCWGYRAFKIEKIDFQISSLALGDNQVCSLSIDGFVRCWGEGSFAREEQFISVHGYGRSFCGVLAKNFSLICWGNEIFAQHSVVYGRVLPGACVSNCSCGVLPGSGNLCPDGAAICRSCAERENGNPITSSGPPPNSPSREKSKARDKNMMFIVMGGGGALFFFLAVGIFLSYRKGRWLRVHNSPQRGHINNAAAVEEFLLEDLEKVTGNFSDSYRVGSGSFGVVYRATLNDGREVAIKRAKNSSSSSQNKDSAFFAELAMLSRVNHKNLVRLLGFCSQSGERVLVYEYVSNGTLGDHLHKLQSSPLHSWDQRLRVALDAARGIEYLHCYAVPPIIHRDIKSSNILLDEFWTAKVSDFGLSLMGPDEDVSHLSLRAAGTVGYMDPEYYRMQYLTTKSDVYSFGVVLLELLTGFKAVYKQEHDDGGDGDDDDDDDDDGDAPRNVVDFAVPNIEVDRVHLVLDKRLPAPKPSEIESVQCLAYLGADCVSAEGRNRPTMTEVVGTLERVVAAWSTLPRSLSTQSL